ncbi:MAG TPA: hypothetical protein PKE12_11210 [Kiritimatiellia bacterium]|nr:hypothetical protein [Kiritimatiellia bacterium]
MPTSTQSNVQYGPISLPAAEDLTDKEGRLVLVTNASGVAKVSLPNDVADRVLFVLTEGGASGANVVLSPLTPDQQFRAFLDGACVPGDRLTLAAIDGTKDGTVRKLPAAADDYFVFGIAEEAGADGQLVKFRPFIEGIVTVT